MCKGIKYNKKVIASLSALKRKPFNSFLICNYGPKYKLVQGGAKGHQPADTQLS